MPTPNRLSVIVPICKWTAAVEAVRSSIFKSRTPLEVIYVVSRGLEGKIKLRHSWERVLTNDRLGRGYPMLKGVKAANGDVIMILHSDTLLPDGWDLAVASALRDGSIAGGGFSYDFDLRKDQSHMLAVGAEFMMVMFGDLWGDRALFARADVMNECLDAFDTPFFEDARLSHKMKEHGRVVVLKQKVMTSGEKFRKRNLLVQMLRIFKCRVMMSFGVDPWTIYNYYYS